MSEHTTQERNGHLRTDVKLASGETVALCRCFGSKKFPFCDGTHQTLDSTAGPVIVSAPKEDKPAE
ncbi:MAG: CDGSH iron-sulfur domain-containing protein [Anaerolineales bacterium]|jgi:CDGSH-type Zn-finger protein|nr:CDGSH iron-sulfur domain-containing protein [Anaerolineales bacterium]